MGLDGFPKWLTINWFQFLTPIGGFLCQGIDRERVEQMEARLKEDILREAERYGGAIMVNHETEEGQIFDAWEQVNGGTVQTPLEVYKSLEAEGHHVEYARVPITDGKAPKSSDFDRIAERIAAAPKNTAFVFNCQVTDLFSLSRRDYCSAGPAGRETWK